LVGCGNSDNKDDREVISQTPEIKITQGVIKSQMVKESNRSNSGQFYYSYNKEINSKDKLERRSTLDAYLNIRSPYERVRVELLINRLSREFLVKCSPCHDDYANGVIGPSLLGKSGDFIYKRVMAFKSGERENILMRELVKGIDDEKLKDIADEIAEFNKQIQDIREGKR